MRRVNSLVPFDDLYEIVATSTKCVREDEATNGVTTLKKRWIR
jgi:hypothetical protein